MDSRKQTVTLLAPIRRAANPSDIADLTRRLADVATDLEVAVERGDLGAIVEATRDLRRVVFELEDGRFVTCG
jgi:hypothetical protein